MGRKIPAKKHRGVKDPYKQQEERFKKIKNKVNAKPESTESQEIPRRLQNIAKFNSVISRKGVPMKKKKKKKGKLQNNTLIDGRKFVDREKELPGMTRATKLVPLLQQHPMENYKKFMRRVDRATKEILKEAEFEKKFKVEVIRNEQGQVLGVQHQEKIDPLLSDKEKKDLVEREEKKKAARRERDKRRRGKKRKNDGDDDDDEFSYYQDKFEFGEVVYEPPSLDTEKLTKKMSGNEEKAWYTLRLGMRTDHEACGCNHNLSFHTPSFVLRLAGKQSRSFLFMEKLKGKQEESSPSNKPSKKAAKIPAGRRRILEEERQRVVEAYRSMKASKHSFAQQSTL